MTTYVFVINSIFMSQNLLLSKMCGNLELCKKELWVRSWKLSQPTMEIHILSTNSNSVNSMLLHIDH